MTKSESIGKLAEALSKAQGVMKGAVKDSENPFFKSKYSDLASVWDACRDALSANGLAVTQLAETTDNRITVHTILMHCSGEWIASELSMTPVKNDPQGLGSAITYARRYALSAAVGIAPEDDDGNAASNPSGSPRASKDAQIEKPRPSKTSSEAIPPALVDALAGKMEDAAPLPKITIDQAKKLHIRFKDSLSEELKKNADPILYDWLRREGYINEKKEGSSMAIPAGKIAEVGKAALAYAKTLSREPAQNEDDLPPVEAYG